MSNHKFTRAALVSALALALAAPVMAQTGSSQGGSNSLQSSPQTKHGTAAAVPSGREATATGVTSTAGSPQAPTSTARGAADNTNSKSGPGVADSWADKYASEHQGKISRQAYLDEMGRRFDAMDTSKRNGLTRQAYLDDLTSQWNTYDRNNAGLTPAEVSRITGKVDVDQASVPRTGSGAQAGDMGPQNVRK